MLQTEMISKVNAFQERGLREPAFPNGAPERRDHHGSEPDSHPGARLLSEIRADGHRGRRLSRALGHHRQHQRLNHLLSRALGLGTRVSTDLHQAYSQRGQQTQQADQPVNGRPLPFFNAAPTFEALMIVLHQPAMSIPLDPLGILVQASWWVPRSPRSIPAAPRRKAPALPRRE